MSNEVVRSFLFADISGFTALTEAHGDDQAADCAARFYELAQQSLVGDARLTKKIGDAVMITALQPSAAVSTALKLLLSLQAEPGFPAVRCGIHLGPIVERDGDFYGATVNLAARLTAFARSDQVLCTRQVADMLSDMRVNLRSCGSAQFKNVAQPVEVFEITGISQASEPYIPALSFRWLTPLYDIFLRWGMREAVFKRHLIDQAQLMPGMGLLDLGCGRGH